VADQPLASDGPSVPYRSAVSRGFTTADRRVLGDLAGAISDDLEGHLDERRTVRHLKGTLPEHA
jgi:hypothetical protein